MNDRVYTAIIVPAERGQDVVTITGTVQALFKHAGIDCPNIVRHTENCQAQGFVAIVEDQGQKMGYKLNSRAVILTGYPGRLLGDCLFMGEALVDDSGMPRIDLVDVGSSVLPWIRENLAIMIADFLNSSGKI